ncbi:hypothetical protein LOZ57_001554 [Ophidiomyces ophidiicola]|uniref:uncharacterized protein n=1 Tax=Ophidiomyces ophidiicola TaxID=1387563 RepID=UPI0020C544C7|nr:uncharacterized protein LOZ57_001554 [Ophidiomyces ophidiicola]KAI1951005.1 hypothetical protein LOZ57_001554 [Ophidiomyces ophidiicola]KAI2060947.1 hypothetical protein LOZ43_001403 [Ophidiomyces ophidiicola]
MVSSLQTSLDRPQREKPSQVKFIREAQMSLFANILSWPPLARVTFLERSKNAIDEGVCQDKVNFTVLLESSRSFPEQAWEVSIWHNINGKWTELPLQKNTLGPAPVHLGRAGENYHQYTFSAQIEFPEEGKHASFTVKYRTDPGSKWQWINEQFGTKDGEMVFSPRQTWLDKYTGGDAVAQIADFIENLDQRLNVQNLLSEAPGAALWSITGNIGPAVDAKSRHVILPLGLPKDFVRNFSLVRIWTPWLAPRHGMGTYRLTEDAILSSFLRKDGLCLVLLAISGPTNILTVLRSTESGEVIISAKNDDNEESEAKVLASAAPSFDVAIASVMYEARKCMRSSSMSLPHLFGEKERPEPPAGEENDDVNAQWMSSWYDGLAYCTWNSLGQNLTEEKILLALETLKANDINVVNLIIDDNWQSLDNKGQSQFKRGWTRFEANEDGFPKGLRHTIDTIRNKHKNIKHIAVWHALMGYWGGISPSGEIAKRYKTKLVRKVERVAGGTMLAIDPDDIYRFYNDLYSFLLAAGVDSVKTDAQFFLDALDDATDRARFTKAYQDAWSISTLRYFQAKAISCMSQAPQIIFHSQLPTTKPRILLRNSDDFFPDIPSSHPWHIFCNAHNSLLTRFLNVVPDWDMFQTHHPYASFHGAARCVSGGPIYITDEPGKHDLGLVNQMSAPSVNGATVILRPSVLGATGDVYHNYHEGQILKVGTYTGRAETGSGILGLFNIASEEKFSLVSIFDFPGITSGSKYVIRAHSTGNMTMGVCDQNFLLSISLEQRGWEILTVYPVQSFCLGGRGGTEKTLEETHVAVLGLLGKMTGAAAIIEYEVTDLEDGRLRLVVTLKALGELGIFISNIGAKTVDDNFMVLLSGRAVPAETVAIKDFGSSKVLSIDVLAAWRKLKLQPGWSNEVALQIFMK